MVGSGDAGFIVTSYGVVTVVIVVTVVVPVAAALNSAETIRDDGGDVAQKDINSLNKLTNDVLKQAIA